MDESERNFIGSGDLPDRRPWVNSSGRPVENKKAPGHPAGYLADPGLVDAVNTALILTKPLLLTGRPGTGKSELAERIAWEFEIGPVLRFEAQSLTEAQDLFYRFDLVGQMADAQLARARGRDLSPPEHFLTLGPIGEAIRVANPSPYVDLPQGSEQLVDAAIGASPTTVTGAGAVAPCVKPRRSVVLVDEIDKAARDVPNDLLNGIERMEFSIRELRNRKVIAPDDPRLRPIVVITSNSERDLPEPFLRRCVFYHIPDPTADRLREILRARVAGLTSSHSGGAGPTTQQGPGAQLEPFYEALLSFFVAFRDGWATRTAYTPGTSELLDWVRVLQHRGANVKLDLDGNKVQLGSTLSAVVKDGDDVQVLLDAFQDLRKIDLRPLAT